MGKFLIVFSRLCRTSSSSRILVRRILHNYRVVPLPRFASAKSSPPSYLMSSAQIAQPNDASKMTGSNSSGTTAELSSSTTTADAAGVGNGGGSTAEKNSSIILKWSSNPDAPLVFLFGWAGCQDRYLSKYSQIYEANGCSVLRFTVPVSKVKCYSSYRRFATDVYDKALNLSASEMRFPIFFHVFSMNGCSLLSSLWDLLGISANGEAVKRMVKGFIFDSCPANVMPWQGADAVSFAMMPPSRYGNAQRAAYRYLLTGVFSMHRALVWLRSFFESGLYEQHFSYFHMLTFTDLPRRQLYLYSKADVICSADSIESFRDSQAQRKDMELKSKCWEDSSHVEHLRKYPQEYAAECIRFIGTASDGTPSRDGSADHDINGNAHAAENGINKTPTKKDQESPKI